MSVTIDGSNGFSLDSNTVNPLVSGTTKNSTSGTSVDYTGIPSWAKRITVVLNGVSTNGTGSLLIRLGTSSGFTSSGYTSGLGAVTSSNTAAYLSSSAGFVVGASTDTSTTDAVATIVNQTGKVWFITGTAKRQDGATVVVAYFVGGITLGDFLDRVQVTTSNGTDTFDSGSINILYE